MGEAFGLSLLDGRVSVTCDVPTTAEWLRGMLLPAFAPVAAGADDVAVHIFGTDVALGGGDDAELLPCFALDREVVHLPGRRAGDRTVIDDELFAAQYVVSSRRVELRPAGRPRLLGASFRAVRELGVVAAAQPHRIQLHASAMAASGGVVLFAGPKEAGKTTAATCVSAATGAALVANDRVFVVADGAGWSAHGVPTIVQVRAPTIGLLPQVRWPRAGEEQPVMSTLDAVDWAAPGAADGSSPLTMSLAQLARAAGVGLDAGGPLRCVALLVLDDAVPRFGVRRLRPDEAACRLDEVRFGAATEPRSATVFEQALGHRDPPGAGPDVLRRLAQEVPCVEVTLGRRFVDARDAPGALLDELLGC